MTRTPARRRARGQAVVELALGTLLIVTILVFALHFTETGYLSVKVTEAAHSAMLDATGYKLHDWTGGSISEATTAATMSGQAALSRYQDFDSRKSNLNSGTVTLTFTQASNMNVQCNIGGGPGFDPTAITSNSYEDNGGMTCTASADVTAFRFPTNFLEDANQGFFQEQHYQNTPIHVCAIGRANGMTCPSTLTTMLDDWGLAGADEGRQCIFFPDVPACQNTAFLRLAINVHILTGLGMGFSGSSLALQTVGMLPFPFFPGAENVFWLSAAGSESAFLQPLSLSFNEGLPAFPTTPGLVPAGLGGIPYTIAYAQRGDCFLGRNCP